MTDDERQRAHREDAMTTLSERPIQRFRSLIQQLQADGSTLEQIASMAGVVQEYIESKHEQIGALLIHRLHRSIGLDPRYFFDDPDGDLPYDAYLAKEIADELKSVVTNEGNEHE